VRIPTTARHNTLGMMDCFKVANVTWSGLSW
jgi:hypothetical protein